MGEQKVYAGIDIGATSIKFGLTDHKGSVLYKEQRPTVSDKGPEALLHLVANVGERLLLHAAEEDHDVRWLGIGTPGTVDFKTGKVLGNAPNIEGWAGTEVGTFLRGRLNLPVYVDNDVNGVALAEHRFGAGIGYNSLVCVAVGTGVGGGIIINGQLWRGAHHAAGEIGHIPISANGPVCRCGRTGCVEAYCSSTAMIERTKARLAGQMTAAFEEVLEGDAEGLTIKKLFAAARKKDAIALDVVEESARYLAIGLTAVVNLINPDLVIIGGGIADGGGGFVEAVAAELRTRTIDTAAENLKVVKAALGNSAGFIGAGLLGEEK